jgi:hypothetical protein
MLKGTKGRRWTLDDAWWTETPAIANSGLQAVNEWDADEAGTETMWADDAEAWAAEPQTSPDIANILAERDSQRETVKTSQTTGDSATDIDPLWRYF